MTKSINYLILSFLFCFSIYAQDTTSIYSIQEEQAQKYILDNGMVALIKENHSSKVVAIQILVKAGSATEGEYSGFGISHFVEHMLFKGTKKRKVGDIPKEISSAGGSINAYTSYEETVYHTVIASQYFDVGLDVLADSIMNSSFDEEEFKKEKDVILKEINMNEDDPGRFLYRLFWNTAYTKHTYRNPVIGYRELFSQISRDDLLKYYKEKYVPNNMIISIAGDINTEEVHKKIKEIFKDFIRGRDPAKYIPREPRQLGKRELKVEKDINVTHLILGYHGPSVFDKELYAMDILAMILGQGRSSRLYKELKEKEKLVYSIHAFSYTPNDPGVFGVSITLDGKNVAKAEELVSEEIKKIHKNGFTDDELKKNIAQILSDNIFGQQTAESQARTIASDEMIAGHINFSKEYLNGISNVTNEDIKKVIEKYFTEDNLTIVSIVPNQNKSLDTTAQQIQDSRLKVQDSKLTTLSNGIRLLTKENHDLPIVSVKVVFEGGVRFENEKTNGISNFMQNVIKKGTQSYTNEQIDEIIESMGASLEAYDGYNSFGFTLSILKKDFDKGFKLLESVITEPTFPEDEIEKERDNILMAIRTRDDQLFNYAGLIFRKTMFKKHPYRFSQIGEEDIIKSIKRDDIIKCYKSFCTPSNMVIAVYGDINIDEIVEKMNGAFKNFNNLKYERIQTFKEEPLDKIIRNENEKKDVKQAIILLGFQGIDIKNEDRFVFDIITGIYSDQGGRLFNRIREEQGLAYYVGAYSILGVDPGAYVFYVGTTSENIDNSLQIVLKEIKSLQDELIKSDELDRVKRNLIGEKAISQQTNESQAFTDCLNELYGLGYNEENFYSEKINKVTAEDIQRVAKKYFNLEHYVLTIARPMK